MMPVSSILALDPATVTGWAYYESSRDRPSYGTARFNGTSIDKRMQDYGVWLHGVLEKKQPDVVLYEKPIWSSKGGRNATVSGIRFETITRFICTNAGIPFADVEVRTWRAGFTLTNVKGRAAKKRGVIEMCRMMGFDPADDNQADALGILDYACRTRGLQTPWANTPLEAAALHRK